MVFSKSDDIDTYETKSKELIFEESDGNLFLRMLKYYFNKLGIPITMNDN